jgi:septal ring factor EnvC (AmiA/AmiB activator)
VNRFFSIFNFTGIVAVTLLCAIQWEVNSRLEARERELDQTRIEQSAKIDEQTRELRDDAADLEDLRGRLTTCESDLSKAIAQRDQLGLENKQFGAALDKWVAAVKARDAALTEVLKQRNDAIAKFNDLAGKYDGLLKQTEDGQGWK